MKRKLSYFSASLLLVLLALAVQMLSASQMARAEREEAQAVSAEEKCERNCSDRFEECSRVYGADACRAAFDLCRHDSPKGVRKSGRGSRRK